MDTDDVRSEVFLLPVANRFGPITHEGDLHMSATATQPRTRRNDTSNLDANGVFRLSRQRNADGNVLAPLGSGLACLPDVSMLPLDALAEWRVGPAMMATRKGAPAEDLLKAFLTDVFGPERRRTSRDA